VNDIKSNKNQQVDLNQNYIDNHNHNHYHNQQANVMLNPNYNFNGELNKTNQNMRMN